MANALLNVQFVTNRLGNQSLGHNGFQYRVKQRRHNRCYWICTTRNCRATINTLDNIHVKLLDAHNNPTKLKVDSVLKSSGMLASQIEEPRCAPTYKHILPHQST